MIKKTITYTDYNGVTRVEDFYFNLTKAELIEFDSSKAGGLEGTIMSLVHADDVGSIVTVFKDLILKSYGEKSADGKRFIKSDELRDAFQQTEAYSELFMELSEDSAKAAEFFNGVVPSDIAVSLEEVEKTDAYKTITQNV